MTILIASFATLLTCTVLIKIGGIYVYYQKRIGKHKAAQD